MHIYQNEQEYTEKALLEKVRMLSKEPEQRPYKERKTVVLYQPATLLIKLALLSLPILLTLLYFFANRTTFALFAVLIFLLGTYHVIDTFLLKRNKKP